MKNIFRKHWKNGIGIIAGICVGVLIIWHVPHYLVSFDELKSKVKDGKIENMQKAYEKYHQLVKENRTTMIQIVGGALFLLGMYIALRRAKAMEDNVKASRETLTLEQYTRAIDQLGREDSMTVRLGGIYSLEQIMNSDNEEDEKYHDVIIELLCAYVREKRPFDTNKYKKDLKIFIANPKQNKTILDDYKTEVPTDIQAILTVLGRRKDRGKEKIYINLRKTNLYKSSLYMAHFENTYFSDSLLDETICYHAHFENAILYNTHFKGADLVEAHLEHAYLFAAHLENANLKEAHLEHANLMEAHLEFANLFGTHLEHAKLFGTQLEYTNLMEAHLENIILVQSLEDFEEIEEDIIDFIKELEKARFVEGIKLDEKIIEIIMKNEKDYPKLFKEFKDRK